MTTMAAILVVQNKSDVHGAQILVVGKKTSKIYFHDKKKKKNTKISQNANSLKNI